MAQAEGMQQYTPPADGAGSQQTVQITDEQIKAMSEKSGDSVEHIREMLKLADKGTEGVKAEKLAGKFADDAALNQGIENITAKLNVPKEQASKLVEAMGAEEAYKYWQSKLSKDGGSDKGAADNKGNEGQVDALNKDADADKKQGDAQTDNTTQFDINKYSTEYEQNGQLSEQSYADLAKQGIPKAMVDAYIAGLEAQGTVFVNNVNEIAGGEAQYDAMVTWAADNLTQGEKDRFNSAIDSRDFNQIRPLMEALKARYERAEGTFQRKSIEGSEANNGLNVAGYESADQMQADMRDPRYKAGDPAFHAYVRNRVKATKAF